MRNETTISGILATSQNLVQGALKSTEKPYSVGYRFGFNGQEKTDEIAGTGNHNTALFWEYDTRTGRRWNIDPMMKTWESPYLSFSGNPIWFNDPLGNSAGDYWKYNPDNKEMENKGSDGKSDGKHYVQTGGGDITVTPENIDDVKNNFALLPSNKSRGAIGEQYDIMKAGYTSKIIDTKIVTGSFYEKGGFEVQCNSNGEPGTFLAPDGPTIIPPHLSDFSKKPDINPLPPALLLGASKMGYSTEPDIVWHLHASATIEQNTNTFGGTYQGNLWGNGPSGFDLSNAAGRYSDYKVKTLLQIDTHDKGKVNFYNSSGTYFSMPLSVFRKPLTSTAQ